MKMPFQQYIASYNIKERRGGKRRERKEGKLTTFNQYV